MTSATSKSVRRVTSIFTHLRPQHCFSTSHLARPFASSTSPRLSSDVAKIGSLQTHHDPAKQVQDKLLFTPGPLTTSYTVKQAMLTDAGSRDKAFIKVVADVRSSLLEVAGVDAQTFTTIIIQGSGTYAIEAVLSSVIPRDSGALILVNGAYGQRQVNIMSTFGVRHVAHEFGDDEQVNVSAVEKLLQTTAKDVSHISMVHSETTSGIINDITAIGALAKKYNKSFIVDAMSSFGAVDIDINASNIDYIISSANKCIEGVPGFSFIIARKTALNNNNNKHKPLTLSLNIYAQLKGLDSDGQFRFTPPTHSLLAFHQALHELHIEGGVSKRRDRYINNQQILQKHLYNLGFILYLKPELQGHIISSYRYPTDKNWSFNQFYEKLNNLGFVIYPGKVSKADCFRIGHIGRIFQCDTLALVQAIEQVCKEMKTAAFAEK